MLYLNPPQAIVEGVTCFPDHRDPLQWYYQPLVPRVTYRAGVPQLVLRAFNSEQGGGGILDFDVNLGLEPAHLLRVQSQLKSLMQLEQTPRLVPMPPKSGAVRLLLLGHHASKDTGKTPDPAKDVDVGKGLVRSVAFAGVPSLTSDNQASFSVYLDELGAQLVEASLTGTPGEMTAVGVIYDLKYDGLRPAYNITARASWKRIHDSLSERFKSTGLFTGSDISKHIDSLVDQRDILLEVDDLLGDKERQSAISSMVEQVKTMVMTAFFTLVPRPQAPEEKPGIGQQLLDLYKQTRQMSVLPALSQLANFTWTREQKQDLLDKELVIDLRERTTVTFELHPQGHLTDLVASIPNPPPLVQRLTLNDDLYKKRTLTVDSNMDFSVDRISSIVVDLDYGGDRKSLLLKPEDGKTPPKGGKAQWLSRLDNRRMVREVEATYTVNFAPRPDENSTWPTQLVSAKKVLTGDYWTVNPHELYQVNTARFELVHGFEWATYASLHLQARYTEPGLLLERTFLIKKDSTRPDGAPGVAWPLPQRDPAAGRLEYKVGFRLANGSTREEPWRKEEKLDVLIEDPLRARKSVRVRPPSPWPSTLDALEFTLFYEDPAHKVSFRKDLFLEAGGAQPPPIELNLADPAQDTYEYEALFYFTDTTTARLPRSSNNQGLVRLDPAMPAHQRVSVRLASDELATHRLRRVEVEVKHEAEPGLTMSGKSASLPFESGQDVHAFEYDFRVQRAFSYRPIYFYTNDTRYTGRWAESTTRELRVPLMANPNG